jgi:hypothetical protein
LTFFKACDAANRLRRGASARPRQTDGLDPSGLCFRALTMRSLGSNTAGGG